MVQFTILKGKPRRSPFPHDLTLAVRFYRAMFINPNLNVLAAMDFKLVCALHEQREFWYKIDETYRKNPRQEIQDIVKQELSRILTDRPDGD